MHLHCNFEWTNIFYIYSKRDNSNTVMEYMCHKCSACKHFSVLSPFMTYHRIYNKINTTGTISGAGTAYHSGAPEFTTGFSGVRVTQSLVLCVHFVDRYLSFFFWPLCCLFFFDIWILIAPLVSSNSSNTKYERAESLDYFINKINFTVESWNKLFFSHLIGITCTWYIKTCV